MPDRRPGGLIDMDPPDAKASVGLVGACAICAACCAGPIVGFFAAIGIASLVGAVAFGALGLLIVAAVSAIFWRHRRRRRGRQQQCAPSARTTPVDAPQVKARR
jgi:membrane protein implicated in regulation of membrane protease activity